MDFVGEMQRVNHLDNMIEHGALKGSIFKAKMLSPRLLKGVCALTASVAGYSQFAALSMLVGPNLTSLGLVASAYYGMMQFYETESISQIDFITEGENTGKLRMKVRSSPFTSFTIIADPKDVRSVVALGNDDLGETDLDQNVL